MFEVRQLTPSIGAEISGISLNDELNDDAIEQVYNSLIKHQVIFFRNQNLSP